MKKLNKKGFTLVELLVVIVILVIIMSIAIPSITSSLDRSKEKQRKAKIELIESAGEIYFDKYKNNIQNITISDLYNERLVTIEQLKDPFNDKNCITGDIECNGSSCTLSNVGSGECPS